MVITKSQYALGFALVSAILWWGCSETQPPRPNEFDGILRGKVTEVSTLPIHGAQINLVYDLGGRITAPPHRVKKPAPGFVLEQNYPNPYEGETAIEFTVPQRAMITLDVVNARYPSNIPATLITHVLQPGRYKVLWNSLLPDSTFLTNGRHLYRMKATWNEELLFEDEYCFFHNDPDLDMIAKMQPLTTADINGQFAIAHALTSIGDTVAVTSETSPEIHEAKMVGDSITVVVSRVGFKTAMRRVQFRKNDAPELDVVLIRQ